MTVLLGALVVLGSWLGTWAVRDVARRGSWLDVPNHRSSHEQATPRGGGLAIAIASLLGLFWTAYAADVDSQWYVALGLLLVIAVLGFADDQLNLSPGRRLVVQTGAAAGFLAATDGWTAIDLPPTSVEWGVVGIAVGTLLVVAHTNFFNFMDGIDGLAAVQAITVAGGMALVAHGAGDQFLMLGWIVLGAAACGFLPWNLPPARIFMGDVGSVYLGFTYAAFAVVGGQRGSVSIATFLLLSLVFWVDACATLLLRMSRGQGLSVPHRTHAYQLAARMLGSHRPVTLTVATINGCLVGAALLTQGNAYTASAALTLAGALLLLLWAAVQVRWAFNNAPDGRTL